MNEYHPLTITFETDQNRYDRAIFSMILVRDNKLIIIPKEKIDLITDLDDIFLLRVKNS
jgi:hypothetical protein